MTFSAHSTSCFDNGRYGPSFPRAKLLRIVTDLPNPIARHVIFQLSVIKQYCCGLPPSALHRGHVPIVVRRLFVGETRADIRIRIRGIVIRIRIRDAAIRVRVVVPAIDHTAYWAAPPTAKLRHNQVNRE